MLGEFLNSAEFNVSGNYKCFIEHFFRDLNFFFFKYLNHFKCVPIYEAQVVVSGKKVTLMREQFKAESPYRTLMPMAYNSE